MTIGGIHFEWDETKARANRKKHGVSFAEAATIFANFPLEIYDDPDHSEDQHRYIAAGFSSKGRILLVVHCENDSGSKVRIISARRATARERVTIFGGTR